MSNSKDMAVSISEQISNTDTYKNFKQCRDSVENNPEATKLMKKQEEVQMAIQSGELTREEGLAKIESINQDLRDLEVIKNYESAKSDLVDMLSDINDALSSEIDVDFADFTSDCCRD